MVKSGELDRRAFIAFGAMGAAVALAPNTMAQDVNSARPSRLRHYVIAAKDLDAVCRQLYDLLQVEPVAKPPGKEPTLAFGFRTRMIRVGTTMLEIVSPVREPHQLHTFFAERGGDGGFMVVLQTYDDDALLARAAANGHKLAFEMPNFMGQHLMQFDYKTFGARFEFYKYTPEDNWWGNPLHGEYNDPKAAEDIMGGEVAVPDPAAIAATAAATFLARQEGSTVHFIDRRIDFVASGDGPRGLTAIYLKARDRSRVGETATVANVAFRFV